ncbi:hypothetical protein KW488_05900 [Vibrio fluvialis]|nr:hypothetical protein [Vibrio fluvialis]
MADIALTGIGLHERLHCVIGMMLGVCDDRSLRAAGWHARLYLCRHRDIHGRRTCNKA